MAAKPWIVTPLALPVGDTVYEVWPVTYDVGLTLVAVQRGESKELNDETEDAVLFAMVMGDTWQQMLNDEQPFPVMFRAGVAALQFQTSLIAGLENDEAVAIGERVWETGLLPELVAAQVAAANDPSTSKPSPSTGEARATRSPASSSGTRSRTATKRTRPTKAAPRSPGKKSPNSTR